MRGDTYDPDGNLTKTTAEAGNSVLITYDALGRKHDTTDPDLGNWNYGYNGFGDVVSQADASNKTTTMTYDQLGRMTTKTDPEGNTAEWVYDVAPGAGIGKLAAMISAPDPKLKGACTIPNTTQTSGNRAGRSFTYTAFGDVAQVDECIDGETFSTRYDYDDLGRQRAITYPEIAGTSWQRFGVVYRYTSLGFLQTVSDASDVDHKPSWVAKSMNAAGQVTDEYTLNGVETVSTRNPSTGWLMDATTTAADNNAVIQKWTNTYDEVGNLRSRARSQPTNMADSVESFGYDSLDRLTSSEVKIPSESYDVTESFAYDNLGNLTQKGGQTYSYTGCGGRPHAVCQVANTSFSYDGNGNMINASFPEVATGKAITYNAANKMTHITSRPASTSNDTRTSVVDFIYGADGNRVVQSVGTDLQSDMARTVYVGMGGTGKSLYERTTNATTGETEHVQFVYAGGAHGGNALALRVVTTTMQSGSNSPNDSQNNQTVAMRYQHFDHLGSVTAITDENGRVVGALGGAKTTVLGYDSWGARRSPDGRPATVGLALQPGHREFTSHETIPSVGLVNMNGRVYDPALGRFLSPDPNVQFVADLQSYNRYSYVLNNPLRYTDPTGYGFWSFLTSSNFWIGLTLGAMDAITCAGTGGAGCVAMMAITTYYQSSTMLVSGVPFDQVAATTLFGIAAGAVGGAIGGGIAGQLGTNPAWQVLGGAIAGTVAGGLTTLAFGGSLGQNIFLGAASGAMSASLAWAAQSNNPLSQRSAAESQGGGGSGADKAAAIETSSAATGRPGSLTAADLESIVNGDVTNGDQIPGQPAGRIPLAERVDPGRENLIAVDRYGEAYGGRGRAYYVDPDALAAYRDLRSDAAAAGFGRNDFTIESAYRSQGRQDVLFAEAAHPGSGTALLSEHITGRALDLNLGLPLDLDLAREGAFNNLATYQWLRANEGSYGFNPYSAEPWHISYNVGR